LLPLALVEIPSADLENIDELSSSKTLNKNQNRIMTILHQKRLQSIQEQMKLLQQQQLKYEQALASSILKALQSKQALSLDMNALVGGIFSVIEKIKNNDPNVESWIKQGQQFFNQRAKASKT